FLAGVADLNQSTKNILERYPKEVLTFVFAPEDEADSFDGVGGLIPHIWSKRTLPLGHDQCHRAEDASHQAEDVYQYLASFDERTVEDFTLGLTDDTLAPYIEERFFADGVVCRHSQGKALQESRPVRLLQVALRYLESRQFSDLAEFLRQVDVQRALHFFNEEEGVVYDIFSFLDSYQQAHLPSIIHESFVGNELEKKNLAAIITAVEDLLGDLTGSKRALIDWQEPLLSFLRNVYDRCVFHDHSLHDRMVVEACQKLKNQFLSFDSHALHRFKRLTASEALKLVLRSVRREVVSPEPKEEAIEMLGWLELPLDDAPVVAVIGCAEGHLPESVNADAYLPNSLRAKLGLLDNDTRAARDTYALHTLLESRESVHLFYSGVHPRGDFLPPSRLFFQVDQELLADRALQLYVGQKIPKTLSALERRSAGEQSNIAIPRPLRIDGVIDRMSITSFRSYLRCPYRFYLQHVLKLKKLDDAALELDAPSFGNLVHDVLKSFFTSSARTSTEEEVIRDMLFAEVTQRAKHLFGSSPLPAVLVQIEQMKHRLLSFAAWQAKWRVAGWIIEHAEYDIGESECFLDHDAGRTMLSGRIDRIDRHEQTGELAVFDYKTGELGQDLVRACSKDGLEWYDLQLPLYEHALRQKGFKDEMRLGHIALARSEKNIGHTFADWKPEHLEAALHTAKHIAASVYRQEFWPPADDIFAYDDFAAICGMEQYQHDDWEEAFDG
ncbi:MAG: PD-(D/E)XK nuclease family protein, partial [Bdellovibrionales bacterium]|nr:PD-(D/E)XK nuclease family protein [Bdellovibrionales bacterium]